MLHAKNTTISGDVQPSKCSPFEWILPLPVDICYLCWNNAIANLLYRTWRNLIFYIVALPSSPLSHIVCYSLNSVSHNMCEWKPNYVHHINWYTHTHTPLSVEERQTILVERSMQDSANFGIALVAWKRRRSHSTPARICVTLIRYKLISTNKNSRNLGLKFWGQLKAHSFHICSYILSSILIFTFLFYI